jgi:hypothetical protein
VPESLTRLLELPVTVTEIAADLAGLRRGLESTKEH